ncbi:aspartic peptidase domain-containing protein [Fimicolochytrium jonesii]|uniref:aspartic peptidase domain-containing protein n=1 Tax=Fimicolochytrium jonesii TaxID=1396493 RepID=UPI0022FEEBC9|nr:aspartic peptidase domain-containing protein [Fimicolochytrium jonesii]KAI8825920.1 aspartic peptidase domain-containing protein [Fimicolochytrium jonesii]
MKFSLIACAVLASSVLAAPAVSPPKPGQAIPAVTLPIQKHAVEGSKIDRARNNAKAQISKWGARTHPSLVGGNAPLTNDANELYWAPVKVGSQSFTVDLDTGSSDFWLRGADCTSNDGSCGNGQRGVDVSEFSDTGLTYDDGYGSGSASGEIYQGTYTLAGLTAKNAYFGVSTSETGFTDPADGLFGLGFAALSNIGSSTNGKAPIDELKVTSFGFYLSNAADGDNGEVTFQGSDSRKYTGSFSYLPLNARTYWQFSLSGASISVGGRNIRFSVANGIADTGTTLIIVGDSEASAIYKAIGADSQGNINCNVARTGPNVTFNLGGKSFVIPPSVYVFNDGQGSCISGIMGGAGQAGVVIFGDVFTRQYYTLFDVTNRRVGFALARHP